MVIILIVLMNIFCGIKYASLINVEVNFYKFFFGINLLVAFRRHEARK